MAVVINRVELPSSEIGWEFEGSQFGDATVSFILVDAPPGSGPKLHSHPYEEIFVVQEGRAAFTAGDLTLEAAGTQWRPVVPRPNGLTTRPPATAERS